MSYNNDCENFVMISSLIKTTTAPLSYSSIRSVYTHKERFEQTMQTIHSVKKNIPNCKICLIDCSPFNENENNLLQDICDYFLNLYDDMKMRQIMRYGESKSLAEATQTQYVISFIESNNIKFKNFFKISGRYVLNEEFNYTLFNNDKNVGRIQPDMSHYMITSFYKLQPSALDVLDYMITNNPYALGRGMPYEEFFLIFMKSLDNVEYLDCSIGIDEYLSVNGGFRKH